MKCFRKWNARILIVLMLLGLVTMPNHAQAKSNKKVKLNKTSVTLTVGKTTTLKLKNAPKGEKITWSSSKKKVATVTKKGKVTAKKAGTAKITAKVGKKKYTCKVTVPNHAQDKSGKKVKLNKTSVTLTVGETTTLKLNNAPKGKKITWSSSKEKVATVTKKGKVTAKETGTAKITAKVEKKKYTCQVTVKPNTTKTPTPTPKPTPSGMKVIKYDGSSASEKQIQDAEKEGVLYKVVVKEGVTSIGKGAFEECRSLTSIEIPSSVTSIGDNAFLECSSLTEIVVSKDNSVYDSRDNCNAIIKTDSNTLICGCMNTRIPSSVTGIGNNAFWDCRNLGSIEIPSSVASIGEGAFGECRSLTSIEIPSNVTSIETFAFYACKSLTSIEIPSSVTSIGNSAFSYCSSLTEIVVSKDNSVYDSRDNCNAIIETDSNTLICGCMNTRILSGVMRIGDSAFSGCKSLTSIEIPSSVTSIGDGAFWDCSRLTGIKIPSSVTSIGREAFWDCNSLGSIEIPSSVTSIGDYPFSNWLTEIIWKGTTYNSVNSFLNDFKKGKPIS